MYLDIPTLVNTVIPSEAKDLALSIFNAIGHAANGTQKPRKWARSALECGSEAAALKSRRKGGS
jgi:hypothetical protein